MSKDNHTSPGPLHQVVGRMLSLFKTKPAPIFAFYSIMVSEKHGFSIQSGEVSVKTFNVETFMSELRSFISQRHNVDNFNLITLTFYPPNPTDQVPPQPESNTNENDQIGGHLHPVVGCELSNGEKP